METCDGKTRSIDIPYFHNITSQLSCNNQSESSEFHNESAIKLFQCALHNVKLDVLIGERPIIISKTWSHRAGLNRGVPMG